MLSFGLNVPLPSVVQVPVVLPPVTLPLSVTVLLVAQMNTSEPAPTTAEGRIVNTSESACGIHALIGVRVSTTLPAVASAALGEYAALSVVSEGVKVPVPLVDHWPTPVPPAIAPLNVIVLLEQIVESPPAVAMPAGVIVNTMVSVFALQLPLFVEVSTSVTEAAALSAGLRL